MVTAPVIVAAPPTDNVFVPEIDTFPPIVAAPVTYAHPTNDGPRYTQNNKIK